MTSFGTRWLGRAAGLLAMAAVLAPGMASGKAAPAGLGSFPSDAGAALSRHLVTIADNPRDLAALKGAGEAALALGDPQAALGFLARAEEISPRDGRLKALMGSALLAMEQVRTALRFFDDAAALGIPETEFAGDRGLAYDLIGNPRLAQRDYQLALGRKEDPEVRRRLALSLAISGERDAALRMIDAQLRRQDRAAWRVRAFVLALTGDMAGASNAVRAVMAAPAAAAMEPFLARLPSLGPADRAFAVHFGRFPEGSSSGSASAAASSPPGPTPQSPQVSAVASAITAGAPDPRQTALGAPAVVPSPVAQAPPPSQPSAASPMPSSPQPPPQLAGSDQGRVPAAQANSLAPDAGTSTLQTAAAVQRESAAALSADPPPGIVAVALSPSTIAESPPASAQPAPEPAPARSSFADVAAMIVQLPSLDEAPSAQSVPAPQPPAAAKPATAKPATIKPASPKPQPKKPAPPKEPSRIWVQVAGGADKEALPREFARLKAKAPALFAGKTAWTTTARATNRLLVGPFETEKEARDFVNQLARTQLAGFSWTSEAGQAIERLPAR